MSETTNTTENTPEIEFPAIQLATVVQAPVDDTLSISGMAADAKATGDAIADVSDSITAVRGILFPVGSIYVSTSATAPTFGGEEWNWQEIMIPTTWGDLQNGARSYAEKEETDTPGTLHFWLRIADTEVSA